MIWVLISENALFEVNYNITLCFLAVHLRVSPFRGTRCYTVSVSREKLERHVHCQGDLSFRNHQVVLQGKGKAMATKTKTVRCVEAVSPQGTKFRFHIRDTHPLALPTLALTFI